MPMRERIEQLAARELQEYSDEDFALFNEFKAALNRGEIRAAERDANQYRDQVAAMGKQVGDLQKDVSLARSPGRTTVIVEAAQPAKKGAAPATNRSWAAVTWGELIHSESFRQTIACASCRAVRVFATAPTSRPASSACRRCSSTPEPTSMKEQ